MNPLKASTSLSDSISKTIDHQTVGESSTMSISEPSATSQKFDVNDKVRLTEHELYCYLKQHSIPNESDLIRQEVVKGTQK